MKARLCILFLLACCSVMLPGCITDVIGPRNDQLVWVAIEPIQCLGNSWERDWLEKHDQDYSGYPGDRDGEFAVIKAYFEGLSVSVHALTSRPKYDITCALCTCPRGDTLYVMVNARDVPSMEDMGFRREAPSMSGPITWYD